MVKKDYEKCTKAIKDVIIAIILTTVLTLGVMVYFVLIDSEINEPTKETEVSPCEKIARDSCSHKISFGFKNVCKTRVLNECRRREIDKNGKNEKESQDS